MQAVVGAISGVATPLAVLAGRPSPGRHGEQMSKALMDPRKPDRRLAIEREIAKTCLWQTFARVLRVWPIITSRFCRACFWTPAFADVR